MITNFQLEGYKMTMGDSMTATWSGLEIKARGVLTCFGDGHSIIMFFLTETSPKPAPVVLGENQRAAIFMPFRDMGTFVDMVRNEKPLWGYINSDKPGWTHISTTQEPVGEEES